MALLAASLRSDLRPGELRVVLRAGLLFFLVLASYYMLRPIRDAYGAEDSDNLHWLFTATLVGMLVTQPLYGRLVSRRGRAAFVPICYRFLLWNAVAFGVGLEHLDGETLVWVRRAFFVWLSVYNLLTISLFWGFLADLMGDARAKRLYGRIALGGTLGAICGSFLASLEQDKIDAVTRLVGLEPWGRRTLLLPIVSALLLEAGVRAARAVERAPLAREPDEPRADATTPVGGRTLDGFRDVLRSRHLTLLCLYVTLFVLGSTMLYWIASEVTRASFADPEARSTFYARMDLWVNGLALAFQLFVTGKVLQRLGIGAALAAVPLCGVLGFGAVAVWPTLGVLGTFYVIRRATEFGFSKPAREALFTVLTREEKYKAKAVIDTVIYRGGDAAAMWLEVWLRSLGAGIAHLAWGLVPLSAVAGGLAAALGREHARRAREQALGGSRTSEVSLASARPAIASDPGA